MTKNAADRFGGGRAVVIGGSMAGLLAARVLADHFDEVTVVERDPLPDGPAEPRKGVPQGRQLHGLLTKGSEILESLFPGFESALVEAGAIRFDFGHEAAWYHFGGWKKSFASGVSCISASRPLIELEVRRRVLALPNVRLRDDCEVTGLAVTDDRARVSGVKLRPRGDAGGAGGDETLAADLTVDASGRGTRLPRWLAELGYERPRETAVKVDVVYGGRVYRVPEGRSAPNRSPHPWKMIYVIADEPASSRIGAVLEIEGGRYIAVLVGRAGDSPPSDPEGYLAYARTLPTGEIGRVLAELEPLGDVEMYKFPANLRRHYDEMARFPEALVVVGDALASFNPIYGQGMTTAALDAMALDASLVEQRRGHGPGRVAGLARHYLRAASRAADAPWAMTTGEDFRDPAVEGRRPLLYPVMKWFLGRVHRACTVDTEVFGVFLRAMHLLDGPEKLLAPGMALRVLRSARAADAASPAVRAQTPARSSSPAT
jgi:2-polyprenyl-6-methoxyphenol hydroxylase-like FAD-dependent oxidoreductase